MDAAVRLEWTWNRLLVPEGLVRTRFVVVADVLGDDAPEVIVTEDEEVAELFFLSAAVAFPPRSRRQFRTATGSVPGFLAAAVCVASGGLLLRVSTRKIYSAGPADTLVHPPGSSFRRAMSGGMSGVVSKVVGWLGHPLPASG